MGSRTVTDGCAASKVANPRHASVEVSTNSVIIRILAHAVTATFQPTHAVIASLPAASSRSGFWKRRNPEFRRVHQAHSMARSLTEPISYPVWLYHLFGLTLRDIELFLAERGVAVSHETIRRWCEQFGRTFAGRLRCRRPPPEDKWYLDEVFIRIHGARHYLWRAADQDGVMPDIHIQPLRNAKATKRLFRRLLRGLQYVPRVTMSNKLGSYGAVRCQLVPKVEQRQSRYLNNPAEDLHRPARRRERQMQRFKSPEHARTSFPLTHLSLATFIHTATDSPPTLITRCGLRLSTFGNRRHALSTLREGHR